MSWSLESNPKLSLVDPFIINTVVVVDCKLRCSHYGQTTGAQSTRVAEQKSTTFAAGSTLVPGTRLLTLLCCLGLAIQFE